MIGNTKKVVKWVLAFLAGFLVLTSGLISIYHLAYWNKIYPHVFVGTTELSNLSIESATERLAGWEKKELPEIKMVFGEQEWAMNLNNLKVEYLAKETAEAAYLQGRGEGLIKDLAKKWRMWFKDEQQKLKFRLSEEKLIELTAIVASEIDETPLVPELTLNSQNQVELTPGKNGRVVKKDELIKLAMERAGQGTTEPITVPVELVRMETTAEQMQSAVERAEIISQKKLIISYDRTSETIAGQALIDLVGFSDDFSEEKVASLSMRLAEKIDREAQNAVFSFDGNKVIEFKPALKGIATDIEASKIAIKTGLKDLLNENTQSATVKLVVDTREPKIKTEAVNDLGIKELLGVGESTFYHSIESRKHNVALTASRINGTVVAPNEVFSFNQAVGEVSAATGFKSAYVIKDGRTVLGDGGGVCQDSTTVFRAALDAGLDIVERHPHSYRVSYYEQNSPPGIDATVYAPSTDLKFKNDTPAYILIQTTVDTVNNYMKVEIYGTSDGRTSEISNTKLWGESPPPAPLYQDDSSLPAGTVKQVDWAAWGARASFDWKVVRSGEMLHQKTFYSNYQPWQAVYLRGV